MCVILLFVKQKKAYDMRISDWSSDVCSSVLLCCPRPTPPRSAAYSPDTSGPCGSDPPDINPAIVVRCPCWFGKAVGDAAVNVEIVSSTDQQHTRLARAIGGGALAIRVEAGIAMASEVKVPRHAQDRKSVG